MVVAPEVRRRRHWPGLGVLTLTGLGGIFLSMTAFLAVSAGVSSLISGGMDPEAAPALENLQKLSAGELREAEVRAKAGFAGNPLDARALITLARVADVKEDEETAARLKLIAGRMQPRVTSIQAETLTILLGRRDFASALTRIDGLIRARPNRAPALLALLAEIASDPEGRNAVASALAGDPPWRASLFSKAISDGKPELVRGLIAELRALGHPATGSELALLINHYLKTGDTGQAYEIWLSSLSEAELDRVNLVYDGGFEGEIRSLSFDWTLTPHPAFSHRTFPRNTASMDLSLQLDFQRFTGLFRNLSQILLLRPGRYRLSGEARFEAFQSPAGLAFRVYCRNGGRQSLIAETPALPQSSQWMAFEKTFNIPPVNCPSQMLRLESRGSDEHSVEIRGQFAMDNLTIELVPELVQ